jgi:hypothetical protein
MVITATAAAGAIHLIRTVLVHLLRHAGERAGSFAGARGCGQRAPSRAV